MALRCSLPECTVAHTGRCLKSHSPVNSCPHLIAEAPEDSAPPPSKPSTASTRAVYAGHELGLAEAAEIMARRYSRLIGVLGESEAGKTCMLCALYLLASCGQLGSYHRFAGSRTLPGFESRLRNYRKWPGPNLPDRITVHTELAHPRVPGFLHLALQTLDRRSTRICDFLFTDLPGEWTTDLIKSTKSADRLEFLRRADGIVITFVAQKLADKNTQHSQLQSARILLQRLQFTLKVPRDIPLAIAVTRCDLTNGQLPVQAYEIGATAESFGFSNVATIAVAAFSENEQVPSGLGLGDLLQHLLTPAKMGTQPAPERGDRLFQRYEYKESAAS